MADEICMCTRFGGHNLSGLGNFVPYYFPSNYQVHGVKKIESAQKNHECNVFTRCACAPNLVVNCLSMFYKSQGPLIHYAVTHSMVCTHDPYYMYLSMY